MDTEIEKENDELRQKLAVAMEALEWYAEPYQYDKCSADEHKAKEALAKIRIGR